MIYALAWKIYLLWNGSVKENLKMSVSPQRFLDMTSSSILSPQLNRTEPVNVASIEEHESNDSWPLVNLERMSR